MSVVCYCYKCKGDRTVSARTALDHRAYGDSRMTIKDVLNTSIDEMPDNAFYLLARYVIGRLERHSPKGTIEVKSCNGKPITFVKTIVPQKAIESPSDAIRRKSHLTSKVIAEVKVKALETKGEISGDIEDVRNRILTSDFRSLAPASKSYIAESCNINKRHRMDSGDTLNMMAKTRLTENGMRVVRSSVNQQFACEKRCRAFEEGISVEYIVDMLNMLVKVGENELLQRTPVCKTSLNSLFLQNMTMLNLYNALQQNKFGDNKIWVKLFMDADVSSTKILLNVLNQERPNSHFKHLVYMYSEVSDKDHNITQMMQQINPELANFEYRAGTADVRLWLTADVKQLWGLLGIGPSGSSKYSCPFCLCSKTDQQQPLQKRGPRPLRSYGSIVQQYKRNQEETGLDRTKQKYYDNIIDEPKFSHALNDDDDAPLITWISVPILHISLRIGKDVLLKLFAFVHVIDQEIAIRQNIEIPDPLSGPSHLKLDKMLSKIGVKPQSYFGGNTITGNHGVCLISRYDELTSLWDELLNQPLCVPLSKSVPTKTLLSNNITDINSLMDTAGPMMRILS